MNKEEMVKAIAKRLMDNIEHTQFGTVGVSLKLHSGKVVAISHEITEKTTQKEAVK